jgi:membrane protein YdbS with pleckstrin-like domain
VKVWVFTIFGVIAGSVLDYFGQWNPWSFGVAIFTMVLSAVWDAWNDR